MAPTTTQKRKKHTFQPLVRTFTQLIVRHTCATAASTFILRTIRNGVPEVHGSFQHMASILSMEAVGGQGLITV